MKFNLLDVIIMLILLTSLIIGYKKGFIGAVAGIVTTVAGLVIAFLYRNQAADYLQEHYGMVSNLTVFLEKKLGIAAGASDQTTWVTSLPMVQAGLAALHRQTAELAYLLVAAGCFLIIYILSSLLIGIFCMLLEKILPRWMLGGINRPGGVLVILTQNILIMAALVGVSAAPLELGVKIGFQGTTQLVAQLQGSLLVPWMLKIFAVMQTIIASAV